MEMEGMEGAILIFMLGNMEQTVARKQTKREKNNAQKRTEAGCTARRSDQPVYSK